MTDKEFTTDKEFMNWFRAEVRRLEFERDSRRAQIIGYIIFISVVLIEITLFKVFF